MSTATAVLKPTDALLSRRVDFPTWLPAMLVKELRQGLRTRGFVGTVVVFQLVMTVILAFAIAGGTGSTPLGLLQGAYWIVLNVQLLIITPARALSGLQSELESRTVDLLLLTRLTAWRVVLGKWISLLVQAALLVIAMLPYGVARYFFGSVDLIGELKLVAIIFGCSAVLTGMALWCSGLPRAGRVALGVAVFFSWQFIPRLVSGFVMTGRRGGPAPFISGVGGVGSVSGLLIFNAALVLFMCLVGAVRRLGPRAESQAPLLRALPLIAFLPVPFLGSRDAEAQLGFSVLLFAFIALIELARPEEPMRIHWRNWSRRGLWGRLVGRFVQPGWASATEWVLVIAAAIALGGLATSNSVKVAQLAMLGAEALLFPALLLTWLSRLAAQRVAGYVLIFGSASMIAAVAAAAASGPMGSFIGSSPIADTVLLLLPISSFWMTISAKTGGSTAVLGAQMVVAAAIFIVTLWRAKPYREQRREFDATSGIGIAA